VAAVIATQMERIDAARAAMSPVEAVALAPFNYSSCDRNDRGELLIWHQNRPAALVWLATGDQWHRAPMDGQPLAHDASVALAYAQELARLDPQVGPWRTAMDVKFLASCVLKLHQEAKR
jgi:hypothetical protein